ncbi:hypothetical protein HYZ97_01225 [Candidatus Pacearchaeota archaeon]|nr:hypothetical protein [Candidatus Pacearchaeota archaeon]
MSHFWPILLVDNEYENISALEEVIEHTAHKVSRDIRDPVIYCESADEALLQMQEAMNTGMRFSAIISDNHFFEGILGEDFLRTIQGYAAYCYSKEEAHLKVDIGKLPDFAALTKITNRRNAEMDEFLSEHFNNPQAYKAFTRYFYGQDEESPVTILYCGNINEADTAGLFTVYLVQKDNGDRESRRKDELSEIRVLRILKQEGVFDHSLLEEAVNVHPRLSPAVPEEKRAYNPSSKHIKRRKLKVKKRKK